MGATKTAGKNPPAVKIPTRGFISSATETEKAAAKEDEGQQLSPAARIFRQPQFNCHIIAILGMGKFIRADELKAGLEATLVRHPRFSSVQVRSPKMADEGGRAALAVDRRWRQLEVAVATVGGERSAKGGNRPEVGSAIELVSLFYSNSEIDMQHCSGG
ncbi:hypothetical protein MA16_Dca007133 [Dendrobium catenatum]|uniref:Uncharacterized protein n=1 Tax=Dendrobium catenatum TaxID=906689 RepID=A0A2I0W3Z4_9ASPA|nr:hypothetical protein MA16_Dca007133 [Dendrobium catenatum]